MNKDLLKKIGENPWSYTTELCGNRSTLLIGTEKVHTDEVDSLARLCLTAQAFRLIADDCVIKGTVSKAINPQLDELCNLTASIDRITKKVCESQRGCVPNPSSKKWPELHVDAGICVTKHEGGKTIGCGTVQEILNVKLPPSGLYPIDYAKGYTIGYYNALGKKVGTINYKWGP